MSPYKPLLIMKFDTRQEGLRTLFKPYQILIMEHLWDLNGQSRIGLNTGQAWKYLQDKPEKKSRASVIIFLNMMVDEGILDYEEKTGKGGYHRVYYPKMDRLEFVEHVSELLNQKVKTIFA
jgi:predicted transcriptional regulator